MERTSMNGDRRLEIKVGLFVVATAVLGLLGVLLLGKSKHVFEARATLHATFSDVGGLVQGAPVRIAGVNVGTVSKIMFVRTEPRPQIRVDMQIAATSVGLIRADSVARISAQGLLGDKIVELSAGSTASAQVANNGYVQTATAPDLDQMMRQAAAVLDDTRRIADRAAKAVDQFADAKTIALFRESVQHIHGLLHAADKGEGLAHALFYDKRTATEFTRLETNLSRLTMHVDRGVQHLDGVLAATDGEGRQLLNNVSRAAKSVGRTADSIEESHLVGNLSRASGDLAQMTGYMKEGRGTLGALVVDPTVYEQLVQVLGGVGRSRILRALVRYAISRDEEKGTARIVDENNVPDVKPPKQQPQQQQQPPSGTLDAKKARKAAKR
jgi:phospholipid/cholesterol/gamma-HCH transport system substrate-binding protein